jgi:hypothetical protein
VITHLGRGLGQALRRRYYPLSAFSGEADNKVAHLHCQSPPGLIAQDNFFCRFILLVVTGLYQAVLGTSARRLGMTGGFATVPNEDPAPEIVNKGAIQENEGPEGWGVGFYRWLSFLKSGTGPLGFKCIAELYPVTNAPTGALWKP